MHLPRLAAIVPMMGSAALRGFHRTASRGAAAVLALAFLLPVAGCKTLESEASKRRGPGSSEIILAYDPDDPSSRLLDTVRPQPIQAEAVRGEEIIEEPKPEPDVKDAARAGSEEGEVETAGFNLLSPFFRTVLPGSEIEIIMSDYRFAPDNITLEVGKTYTLEVINEGKVLHYFGADDLYNAVEVTQIRKSGSFFDQPLLRHIPIPAGATRLITIATKRTGRFSFICAVPTHLAQGMTGTITIIKTGGAAPGS